MSTFHQTARSPVRWLLASILAHFATYLCMMTLATPAASSLLLYQRGGDEPDYTVAAEQLLATGDYATDLSQPESRVHRMPGYALTYALFRVMFGAAFARPALVLFQVLLGGVAAYAAASLAYRATDRLAAFYVTLVLGLLPSFPVVWNSYTLPDGLSASVLVGAVFLLSYPGRRPAIGLVAAGALWTYSFFLRPYLAALGIPFVAYLWVGEKGKKRCRRDSVLAVALFVSVATIAESAWIARNWMHVGRFVPLHTAGFILSPPYAAAGAWLRSFGGDIVWWRQGAAAAWLYDSPFASRDFVLPDAVVSACGSDEIAAAKSAFLVYLRGPLDERAEAGRQAALSLQRCRQAYELAAPFDHEVTARLRLLRSFVVHAGPPIPTPRWETLRPLSLGGLLKMTTVGAYVLTIGLGLPGILALGWLRSRDGALLATLASFPIILFPFVLRFVETRYWASTYPFLVIAAALAVVELPRWIKTAGTIVDRVVGTPDVS